ncbi:unnamed protein product [Prorocentrum cordatum]|uniref:Protein kinase domain-containing protein n=1 Tax=Prorocentrum cordatum TaxID=2364126 RepID=A0ABN9QM57_9DINO|nr:unnamed protein product [Polarella glacialis]
MGACTSVPRISHVNHELSGVTKKQQSECVQVSKSRSIHEAYSFRDTQKLGQGGYGAVYRATQRATGTERAVKRMSSRTPHQSSRCMREVSIMNAVDHPNIVKLVETFQDSRNTYLVVELCRGGDLLSRMVAYGGSFSEQNTAMVLQQIFRGTLYLHQCSIAHRDLKPDNLLFANDVPVHGNTVKIIDFGLARTCNEGQILMTKVGTPIYVAPEVLAGRGYDKQCDNWSTGIVAHVLLCGYPPFRGRSDESILRKVARGRIDFVPKHWARVSPSAQALVSRLLSPDPWRRPTAALALRDDWLRHGAEADAERRAARHPLRPRGEPAQVPVARRVLEGGAPRGGRAAGRRRGLPPPQRLPGAGRRRGRAALPHRAARGPRAERPRGPLGAGAAGDPGRRGRQRQRHHRVHRVLGVHG